MSARRLVFQPDVLEWLTQQKNLTRALRKERYKMEKGFVAYTKDFIDFFRSVRESKNENVDQTPEQANTSSTSRALQQFYESEELIKRMKWKRVTWDDEVDYTSFSKRILDNDSMFKRTAAFSFLSIHVVKDPCNNSLVNIPLAEKTITAGTLTNWLLQEREAKTVDVYPVRKVQERCSAFHVDWTSGAVKILDTASAQEILTFLSTVAPRLQAVQLMMEDQQTRQTANIEKVRVRVGATLKFNSFETSFWDDPKRKTSPDFVNPDELEQFLSSMLKSAFLYRWFLKGQEIRVVRPGRPYYIDMEKKEIQIPANFSEYNWLKAHSRFEGVERVADGFRRFWWFWFCFAMIVVGDVELM
ncbi:hypothetical protein LSCM1_01154 [Leishmania martiniquensis]|uniref:Uncharacterized protein n=1 Tax=Leishmania martiniquensis TaxID=1580590 RepID=A0A836GXK1_9TRYP|nr:hypothetical protein LSCM1_01154 [Leishmania martiniquensis]